jgi:hypothetical protein
VSVTFPRTSPTRKIAIAREAIQYERTILFQVAANATDAAVTAYLASIGYYIGAPHPDDPAAFITSLSAEMTGKDLVTWQLAVQWSTDADQASDLIDLRPRIRFGSEGYQRRIELDVNGDPILNSAGEWFDEPIEIDDSRPVLTVTRVEATDNWAYLSINFHDCVNSDAFFIAGPRQAKLRAIEGENFWSNGTQYWNVTYIIDFRRETFRKKIVDAGYTVVAKEATIIAKPGKNKRIFPRYPILNADGSRVDKPQLLDGEGGLLEKGKPPVFKEWDGYEERPFTALGLPF